MEENDRKRKATDDPETEDEPKFSYEDVFGSDDEGFDEEAEDAKEEENSFLVLAQKKIPEAIWVEHGIWKQVYQSMYDSLWGQAKCMGFRAWRKRIGQDHFGIW